MSDNEQDEDVPSRDKSPSPPPPPPAKKPAVPAAAAAVPPKTTTAAPAPAAAPTAPTVAAAAASAVKKPEPPKPASLPPSSSQFSKTPSGADQVAASPYPAPNSAPASASGSASAVPSSKPPPGQFSSKGKPATRTGYIAAVAPEVKSLAAATQSELVDLKSLDQHLCAPDARSPEAKFYVSASPYFSKFRDLLADSPFEILPPFKPGKSHRIAIKRLNPEDGKKEDLSMRLPFLLTTFTKTYPDGNWVDAFTKGADPNRNKDHDPKNVNATRVKRGLSILPWSKHEAANPLSSEGEKARTLLRILSGMYVLFGIANRARLGKRFDEVTKDFQLAFETKAIGTAMLKDVDSGKITPELILATERCSHVKPLFARVVLDKNNVKHTLADGTTVYTSNYLFRTLATGEQPPKTEQDKLRLGYPPARHPHRRVVDRLCELSRNSVSPEKEEEEEDAAQNQSTSRIYNVTEMTKPNGAFATWDERLGYGRGAVVSSLVRVKEKMFPETSGNVGLDLETIRESVLLVKPVVRKRVYEDLDHSAWLESNQDELAADLPENVIQESDHGGEGSASGGAPASGSASASAATPASATSARGVDGQSSPKRAKR